jgi:hypothetical protein
MKRGTRAATAVAVAASLAREAFCQTFTTDLKGLGGTPIGLTPLNAPGVSVMEVQYLTQTDSAVRRASLGFARVPKTGADDTCTCCNRNV